MADQPSILYNRNREIELLAHYVREPQLIKASTLTPDHFGFESNRAIFAALRSLQEDRVVSMIEVKNFLDTGPVKVDTDYLFAIQGVAPEVVDQVHVRELQHKVIETASRVSAICRAESAVRSLRDERVSYEQALKDLAATVIGAQSQVLSRSSSDIKDLIANAGTANIFGQRFGFDAHLKRLQDATRGMREGQVWNLNAPYKSYKTRWALAIVLSVLRAGWSVTYHTLEDNAGALVEKLIAHLTGLNEQDVELYYEDECPGYIKRDLGPAITAAEEWLAQQKLRIMDFRHGVYDYQTLRYRLVADKMSNDTNLVVIDHINQYSDDFDILSDIYRSLVPAAQEAQVAILGLSQQSNQSILFGTQSNMLAARGTGAAGMVVHFGFEVKHVPGRDECVVPYSESLLRYLQERNIQHTLQPGDYLKEVGLWLKILRRGSPTKFWGYFEPTSGQLLFMRSDRLDQEDTERCSLTGWDWTQKSK